MSASPELDLRSTMSHFSGLIMIYKKTSTIWCRSFFRSNILHKSLKVLLFHVFLSGFPSLRADDQILVGELFKWELKVAPDAQKIKPLLNPPMSGILHSEIDGQDRQNHHIFLIPNQPGQLAIELSTSPNSKKIKKTVVVNPWPMDPPSTGIRAGVGKISGHWIQPTPDLKVGEMIQLKLRLEGDSAMAIRSAPELAVKHGDSMILARCLGVHQTWPSDAEGPSQEWTYEVSARGPGRYQVQPLRIHTWDKTSQSLQTKLISGISWEVVASPIFNLETAQTPTSPSNSKNFMHRVLLSTGVLAVVLASVLLTLYTGLYYWLKLHVKLYQISSCTDQAKARIWYRRLEPLWAKCRYVQKKCPPKWRALDLSRWAALERLAFGNLKDQDQNPIR